MKKVIVLVGAAIFGLMALSLPVQAQQPSGDGIEIDYAAATCTVSITWTDGTDDSTHLRVSVNAAERPVFNIDDFVGDQDGVANPLGGSFVITGTAQVNARLYTGPTDEAKLLDSDLETHECVAPTATAVPPTATPVPPTATATPTPADDASLEVRKVVEGVSLDPTSFQVDISGIAADITNLDENDAPGTHRRGDLTPGQYVLTEHNIPVGYQFLEWRCESDQLGTDFDPANDKPDVTVFIRAGEDMVCTVYNGLKATTPATSVPPAIQATPVAPVVNVPVTVNVPPIQVQQPSVTQPSTLPSGVSVIRPPSTGDGGLLNSVLPKGPRFDNDPCTYCSHVYIPLYYVRCYQWSWGWFCY